MILDSIVLENFGVYSGRNEAILTPEQGKPVILFGGMNGGGKTTLLDAIQLAFYGSSAKLSSRGKLGYKQYLKESIHRDCDPGEGASITLRFRRIVDGEYRSFELQRYWRQGVKGIEENFRVLKDGLFDEIYTQHWNDIIESYLPIGLAHLFFFDGEQIKDLAEGNYVSEILGTAIHSLLGLNLVDRLESDLKILEKRKRAEELDKETLNRIDQKERELKDIDQELEKLSIEEGGLVNQANRLGKTLQEKEEKFRSEGGDYFLRSNELKDELTKLESKRDLLRKEYLELLAGPLAFLQVESLLKEVERQARQESEIKQAQLLESELYERDKKIIETLKNHEIENNTIDIIYNVLKKDQSDKSSLAKQKIILDSNENLSPKISYLINTALPAAKDKSNDLQKRIEIIEENISRIKDELDLVPSKDKIAAVEEELDKTKKDHEEKIAELKSVQDRKKDVLTQRKLVQGQLDRLIYKNENNHQEMDNRDRILKHSSKARDTLVSFRQKIVCYNANKIENLMLESFRQLLRKRKLVKRIKINPSNFEVTLQGENGDFLTFDRLSAGEKQLLATSLLWGVARASGKPMPTVIDTPLGRLDSSHRGRLVNHYFPNASHQVFLLSTDEEINGQYYEALKPYISRAYLLNYSEEDQKTQIREGYFNDETTSRCSTGKQQRKRYLN